LRQRRQRLWSAGIYLRCVDHTWRRQVRQQVRHQNREGRQHGQVRLAQIERYDRDASIAVLARGEERHPIGGDDERLGPARPGESSSTWAGLRWTRIA